MLSIQARGVRLCDRLSRREMLRAGGLGLLGLSLSELTGRREALSGDTRAIVPAGRAKSCIVLFLMGGPPQHSTWDPKPNAPAEVRGQFGPIATSVPGIQIGELLPLSAQVMHHVCLLRAVSTGDNAHSSSGYYMLTGQPHQPMNFENANPGAPNNWPTLGALVSRLGSSSSALPAAVRLPHHIFNTDGSVWPGQDAGFFGRGYDPWLFHCQPGSPDFRLPEFSLSADLSLGRLADRRSLLEQFNRRLAALDRGESLAQYDRGARQALDVLTSPAAQAALRLDLEADLVRERYGRTQFGQSALLARRLVEAGVSLVQVNWFRGADEPPDNPCWDSHTDETRRLKENLAPPFDRAFSALVSDLADRGLLGETLVVCLAEFGRTPKFNSRGGRDHWGSVFSIALAGGGVHGGMVHGASDKLGAYPETGLVRPADLHATILHCLGLDPHAELHDPQGRPFPAARGEVLRAVLA
jgi:hypothetical protein